jgi:D-alanyl-D-alanine dipeptidase
MVKGTAEVDLLQRAGHAADAAFAEIRQMRLAGRTERQVGHELQRLMKGHGLDVAGWDPIVASGPNAASPHYITGDREIREGDALTLDFGGSLEGYQADITRTVHVGAPSAEFRSVYAAVHEAQQAGVAAARPGVPAQTVDRAARQVIAAAGYGEYFVHRTGHGVGLEVHEEPYIVEGNELQLEPGMTFSVEPGIYLPGKFGVRIEDIVALTENASNRLNNAPRDLLVVA